MKPERYDTPPAVKKAAKKLGFCYLSGEDRFYHPDIKCGTLFDFTAIAPDKIMLAVWKKACGQSS